MPSTRQRKNHLPVDFRRRIMAERKIFRQKSFWEAHFLWQFLQHNLHSCSRPSHSSSRAVSMPPAPSARRKASASMGAVLVRRSSQARSPAPASAAARPSARRSSPTRSGFPRGGSRSAQESLSSSWGFSMRDPCGAPRSKRSPSSSASATARARVSFRASSPPSASSSAPLQACCRGFISSPRSSVSATARRHSPSLPSLPATSSSAA